MFRHVRRGTALGYLQLSEAALRLCGKRQPYGVLTLDIAGEVPEQPFESRLFGVTPPGRDDLFTLVTVLRWAREDPAVRGVLVRCGSLRAGWAKVQELHRQLLALREAGKRVWVYLSHGGVHEYLLASAADQISLAPAGTLEVTGLASEVTFVASLLQKLGIVAEVVQLGRYKSAAETFTRSDMSADHREMVGGLVRNLYDQIVDAVAAGRGRPAADVAALLERGPFVAQEARDAGLVDVLEYADDAEARLVEACDGAAVIDKAAYLARRERTLRPAVLRGGPARIAFVRVSGSIKTGDSIPGPEAAAACGVDSVARDLAEIRDRRDIAAVVVRIASPGGSGLASDLIWHEVDRTRRSKPVVVSFGDTAASGGYYVGVAADVVLAEAGTITGSIGVLAGKAVLQGLYNRVGITKEVVARGRHAALHSDYLPLNDADRERLRAEAEHFYAQFVDRVARGRHLSHAAVEAVAQGRIWTGRQAVERGLVDRLGGIESALRDARILAGMGADDAVRVEHYPRTRRLWQLSLNLSALRGRLDTTTRWRRFITTERLWAVLPFRLRFF